MKTIYLIVLLVCGTLISFNSFSGGSSGEMVAPPPGMPPCAVNPPPGGTACTATPICNPHGFCGTTSGSYTADYWSQLSSGFCGSIENNAFLSFTAESSTISFDAYVYNCTDDEGIQVYIFSSTDCGSGPVQSFVCVNQMFAQNTPYDVTATGLIPGNQYYIMIDGYAGNICDYTFVATDGVAMPISLSTGSEVTICAGESVTTTASGGDGNYTWDPSPDLNTTTGATVTITPPQVPGSYTYTVHSQGGVPNCPSTVDYTLTIHVETCCFIQTNINSVTCNTAAGTYTANVEVSYNFPPATGNLVVNGPGGFTQSVPAPYGSNPYTVSIPNVSLSNPTSEFAAYFTGTSSCSHVINYIAPIVPTFDPISVCQGGEAPILPSSSTEGIGGTWSPAVVNPNVTSNYTFTPNNGNCNTDFSVTVNPLPSITTNSPVTLDCTNPAGVQLTASSPIIGATFSWTDDLGGSAGIINGENTATLTVNSVGEYIVTAINPTTGCENTATVIVNGNNSEPTLDIDPDFTDITCYNYTTTLTGSGTNGSLSTGTESDLTYEWTSDDGSFTTPTNTNSATIDGAGVYTLTITDQSNGCTTSESVIVGGDLSDPIISPMEDQIISCNDSTVVIAGNSDVANSIFTWSTVDGLIIETLEQYALVGLAGTYTIEVQNPVNGCSATANVQVTGNTNIPNVDAGPDLTICVDGSVTLQGSSTSPGVTYNWDATDGNVWLYGFSTDPDPTIPASAWYHLTVTDLTNNCSATDSVFVSTHIAPVIFSDTTFCGTSYQVPANSVSVNGTFTWSEMNNAGTFDNVSILTPIFTPNNPSVTDYTLILTDECTSDTALVSIIPHPTASSNSALCDDPKTLVSNSNSSGIWSGTGVTFAPSSNTVGGLTNESVTATAAPGTYQVTFTNTECNYSQSFTLIYPVDVTLFNDSTVCSTSLQIPSSVIGTGSGTWTSVPSGTFSDASILSPTFTPSGQNYEYVLSYNDACDTASVTVIFPPQPQVSSPPAYSCGYMSEVLTTISYGPGTWTVTDNPATNWYEDTAITFVPGNITNGGMTTESTLISSSPTAGVYNLTFTDSTCGYSTNVTLNFLPYPWTEVNDTAVCTGTTITLNAYENSTVTNYTWSTGENGPSTTAANEGVYYVEVSNECYNYVDSVVVTYKMCDIVTPNVISLSSQNGNNIWYVNSEGVTDYKCTIVNRWGNLVFQYNDVNLSWNGRDMQGNVVTEGVYFYTLEATYENGEVVEKHGFIHVVH